MDATADATEKPAGTPLAVAPAVAVASAVASNPFAGAGATATAPAGLYPSVGPPTPTPGTPYVVANPLQLAVGAPGTPVLVSAASSFALSPGGGGLASPGGDRRASLGASGLGILHQGSRFTKTTLVRGRPAARLGAREGARASAPPPPHVRLCRAAPRR